MHSILLFYFALFIVSGLVHTQTGAEGAHTFLWRSSVKDTMRKGHILVLGVALGQLVADLEADDIQVLLWVRSCRADVCVCVCV